MLRSDPSVPDDAVAIARYQLIQLRARVQQVLTTGATQKDLTTKAHLTDSLSLIEETLKAHQERTLN